MLSKEAIQSKIDGLMKGHQGSFKEYKRSGHVNGMSLKELYRHIDLMFFQSCAAERNVEVKDIPLMSEILPFEKFASMI